LAAAKAMLHDLTVEQVAKRLGVAPSTLYRHLPGDRATVETRQDPAGILFDWA
jgi:AcrR family transcriptional regulator